MPFKYNPFTGKLDWVEITTTRDIIQNILLDSSLDIEFPKAEILYDEDSILIDGEDEL